MEGSGGMHTFIISMRDWGRILAMPAPCGSTDTICRGQLDVRLCDHKRYADTVGLDLSQVSKCLRISVEQFTLIMKESCTFCTTTMWSCAWIIPDFAHIATASVSNVSPAQGQMVVRAQVSTCSLLLVEDISKIQRRPKMSLLCRAVCLRSSKTSCTLPQNSLVQHVCCDQGWASCFGGITLLQMQQRLEELRQNQQPESCLRVKGQPARAECPSE